MTEYGQIRHLIQPGDVVAFGGKGFVSWAIKRITRSPVSHVGIVLDTDALDRMWGAEPDGTRSVLLIESTSLDGKTGVLVNRLSQIIDRYRGDIWWLPLNSEARAKLDEGRFFEFLMRQEGKSYDYMQACLSVFRWLPMPESFRRMYCSELAVGALEVGGVIGRRNASKVTPAALCKYPIYRDYFQLKGGWKRIPGFNGGDR
jgi:hypothetical protein